MTLNAQGWIEFAPSDTARAWARVARRVAGRLTSDPTMKSCNLRHGSTWFVGVDALPNDTAGALEGVPLEGPWQAYVPRALPFHRAQLSVIYPGYPRRDPDQSEANHRFRVKHKAAHVDGLLPEGPQRRRFAREFHAYILGIHLDATQAGATLVWPGSHKVMGAAFRAAVGSGPVDQVDLTDVYQSARRCVLETTDPVPLTGEPGASFLLHRFALHGTAPWSGQDDADARMTAFFRPEFASPDLWLNAP